jgi:hypothetical protein
MDIPPVVRLLRDENLLNEHSRARLRRRLQAGLFDELHARAEKSFVKYVYADHFQQPAGRRLVVTPSGALNPFTRGEPWNARMFMGCIALYADRVYVPDVFTRRFLHREGNWEEGLGELMRDLGILRRLLPLIDAGIVRFSNIAMALCHARAERVIRGVATDLAEALDEGMDEELRFGTVRGSFAVFSDLLFDGGASVLRLKDEEAALAARLIGRRRLPPLLARFRQALVIRALRRQIRSALLDLASSQKVNSVVVSDSRADLFCLKTLEDAAPEPPDLEAWERSRAVDVPWVSTMTAQNVLRLRERASEAVPRFRRLLFKRVAAGDAAVPDPDAIVAELRDAAAEARAELSAQRPFTSALAVYGIAARANAGAGVRHVLSRLGSMHHFDRENWPAPRLRVRPGTLLIAE